jgi:lipopolysaccharide transport system permease protein
MSELMAGLASVREREVDFGPASLWEKPNVKELWHFRHLLPVLVRRNVVYRYRQSLLGPAWYVIDPLLRMGIFSLLLGGVAGLPSEGIPYPLFVYSAILPWTLFSSSASRGTHSLLGYMHIISKVYFPRLLLPAAEVLTALADFAISFTILVIMGLAFGYIPTIRFLVIPLLLGIAMILGLGVGYIFAGLQVRFRDVGRFVGYLLKFWEFSTPVVYSAAVISTRVPEWVMPIYRLNPMNPVVEGFRWTVVGAGRAPDWTLAVSFFVAIVLLVFGAYVFSKAEHSIIDLI